MIGILAYGSLRQEPGCELASVIVEKVHVKTPFAVEFGRYSSTRGGAPTLVPVGSGGRVKAEVLVLDDVVVVDEAKSMLWRRETRRERSGEAYRRPREPQRNNVLVEVLEDFAGIDTVIYTDFPADGKLDHPDPTELARAAIRSIGQAGPGQDGISYLIHATEAGIETQLTQEYEEEILRLTGTSTLLQALEAAREGNPGKEHEAL